MKLITNILVVQVRSNEILMTNDSSLIVTKTSLFSKYFNK